MKDLTTITHSERVSTYTCLLSSFASRAYSSTEFIWILKLCIKLIDLGTRYFVPSAAYTSHGVLLTMFRSRVITWLARSYLNGEHVAIRRLRFEVEILQHVFVVENVVYAFRMERSCKTQLLQFLDDIEKTWAKDSRQTSKTC
jgi:hypothetical protein